MGSPLQGSPRLAMLRITIIFGERFRNQPGHRFIGALLFQPQAAQVFGRNPNPVPADPLWLVLRYVEGPGAWTLTREGFAAYADQFRTGDQYASKQLGPRRLEHYLNTNDLYIAAKPALEELLGPYPAWEWRNEARAFRPKTHSGRNTAHQPDAEVRFGGLVFVVERQTRRARKGPRPIYEKVAAHKTYINYDLEDPGSGEILFVCDEPRDAALAERAGDQLGVSVFAGNVHQAAAHSARAENQE